MAESTWDREKNREVFLLLFESFLFQGSVNEIAIDWLRGVDRQLWESFCGMIHQHFRKT